MRYPDCTNPTGECAGCSLVSYGKDCHNKPLNPVAYHRQVLGLTQQALADLAGVSLSYVRKIEYGEVKPVNMTLKNAIAIADAMEIDPRDLLK